MRLTKNENGLYVDNNCIVPQSNDIITKLGQLEDIEEELGIDLLTLFKASKEGFFKTNKFGKEYINPSKSINFKNKCIVISNYSKLPFKDYGKTWALTKEELL